MPSPYARTHEPKECTKCHQFLPAECFSSHPEMRSGLQPHCKDCKADQVHRRIGCPPKPMRTVCGICEKIIVGRNEILTDHDHLTGWYRGHLCRSCNTKLSVGREALIRQGLAPDSKWHLNAGMYLSRSE